MGHHSSPTHPPPLTGGVGTGRSMLSKLSFLLLCGESLPLVQVRHRCCRLLTSGAITLQQTMTHPSYDRSFFVNPYKRRRVQDRTRMTSLEATLTNRQQSMSNDGYNDNNAISRIHCHRHRIDHRRLKNGYKSHRMSTNFLYMANNNDIDSQCQRSYSSKPSWPSNKLSIVHCSALSLKSYFLSFEFQMTKA